MIGFIGIVKYRRIVENNNKMLCPVVVSMIGRHEIMILITQRNIKKQVKSAQKE